ncbi:MAG: glycosyltransferase [Actinomycetaceae bacterium]|nr:glycosyltransferase [Actinomycetaceae bacterium]
MTSARSRAHLPHVLWTPSWYPTCDKPLSGSFFVEQTAILRQWGMAVGVLAVEARSLWQRPADLRECHLPERVVYRQPPMIPRGIVPGDRRIIEAAARRGGAEYAHRYGIPDVIHAHSVFPGILAARALSDLWGVPYGLTEHRPSSLTRNPKSPRFRAIVPAVREAAFRIAVSPEFARQLTRYYGSESFEVVSSPVPQEFFSHPLRTPDGIFRFIHVSHLAPNKRVEETISAFSQVCVQIPDTRLLIVGGDSARVSELKAYAASCGVADYVEFTGRVSRQMMAAEMSRGDCLVLVSGRESGGIVFAEAQSLGLACIASATAGGRHMVPDDAGIVVPIDQPRALRDAMRAVVQARRHSTKFAPSQIRAQAANRFAPDVFASSHADIYRRAIGDAH